MNKLSTLLFFILLSGFTFSQDLLYHKIHGGILNETGKAIVDNGADGFIVLGTTGSNEDVQKNFYLMEVDNELNFEWSKSIGSSQADEAESLVKSPDGGYVLFGTTNGYESEDYDFLVIKVDENGDEIWSKTYGGSDWELAKEIIVHPDGGYLLLGETYSYGNGMNDIYLVYIDEDGNEVWWNTFGGEKTDDGRDLMIRENQTIAITGKSTSYTLEEYGQCSLLLVGLDGELLSQNYYGFDDFEGNAIYEDNGKIRIMGSFIEDGDVQPFFFGLSTNDVDVSYFNQPGFSGDQDVFDFFKYEDNYYCTGYSSEGGNGGDEVYLLETNDTGFWTGSTTFGEDYFDVGNKIIKDPDEEYVVIVGTITGTYNEDGTDVYLLKVPMDPIYVLPENWVFGGHYDTALDISDISVDANFVIYPNPGTSASATTVQTTSDFIGGSYTIYDLQGKIIGSSDQIQSTVFQIQLPSGYYHIRFNKEGKVKTKSFLIH